jgi:hypothetical protein
MHGFGATRHSRATSAREILGGCMWPTVWTSHRSRGGTVQQDVRPQNQYFGRWQRSVPSFRSRRITDSHTTSICRSRKLSAHGPFHDRSSHGDGTKAVERSDRSDSSSSRRSQRPQPQRFLLHVGLGLALDGLLRGEWCPTAELSISLHQFPTEPQRIVLGRLPCRNGGCVAHTHGRGEGALGGHKG